MAKAKATSAVISNTGNATVITGQGVLPGWIVFLNGPVVVWSGSITDIPDAIPGPYSVISINLSDYERLFGSLPDPVPVDGISEPTIPDAEEVNKIDQEEKAKLHASFNRIVAASEGGEK